MNDCMHLLLKASRNVNSEYEWITRPGSNTGMVIHFF